MKMKQMNESWDAETSRKIKEKEDLAKMAAIRNAVKRRHHERKRREIFGDDVE